VSKSELHAKNVKAKGNFVQFSDANTSLQKADSVEVGGDFTQQSLSARNAALQEWLLQVLASANQLGLPLETQERLLAEVRSAQSHLSANPPRTSAMSKALNVVTDVLKGAATKVLAGGAAAVAQGLLKSAGSILPWPRSE
jgi:aspartyl/asparaginyl-tRNA synthetase